MTLSVHNPDQYMASLRHILAQGRKRLGLLVGAGAPAGTLGPDEKPLIPTVEGLTSQVLASLQPTYGPPLDAIQAECETAHQPPNVESVLSRVRSLAGVIGATKVHGLDAAGYKKLGEAICSEIGKIVDKPLPEGSTPYSELVNWISGVDRAQSVEIFTTNYDLLFEQALERAKVPLFDGFSGAKEPFFDASSVATGDLPARWVRLWKLHGSLGWEKNAQGEMIRVGRPSATEFIFPDHLKYDQTQKAPYAAFFDRLRTFLTTPDTLLIAIGFSFADAHISARIEECLVACPSSSVFAFQYKPLADEIYACAIARRRSNMSVYSPDRAMINGVAAPWQLGDPPTRDWGPIRASYWQGGSNGSAGSFVLGRFDRFARFFVSAHSAQAFPVPVVMSLPPAEPAEPASLS